MIKNKGFNLITVIIIICISSIISGITTGVIVTNGYKNSTGLTANELASDQDLKEFLEVYSSISDDYYENIDKKEMLDSAIDAMLNYLGDSYTTYMTNEEREALTEKLAGTYKGIGVEIRDREIINVIANSPAEKAGILAGDIIYKVNDIDVTTYTTDMIAVLIKNNKKEIINLTIQRAGIEMTFELKLEDVEISSVSSTMIENTNIGYLYISIFSKNVNKQVKEALASLENEGMEKLIIDLRDNSGGYLEGAESIANQFLQEGKIIYSLKNKTITQEVKDKTSEFKNYPIVVLINGSSASASEILAAALKDSYNAVLIGETSYGKGKVQQTVTLEDGSMAKYTSAKWLRPNGECIDEIGIIPDYVLKLETREDEEGNKYLIDTQFNKAVEYLSTL